MHFVKVMAFNILFGGNQHYPLEVTADVIRASEADVVGVQEADANGPALAELLGYAWHPVAEGTRRGGILSRHPITATFAQGVEITLPTSEKIYVFSVHLRSSPYEPYDIRSGALSGAAAIASARESRGEQIERVLAPMQPMIAAGAPVFLVGDFNEPSHLDWTERAGPAGARLHDLAVAWPTSTAVAAAGLKDSYRTVHADEIAKPGYTWTPFDSAGEIHDRIDFVYFAGRAVVVEASEIVGEVGGTDVDRVGAATWPSDHRALVGTFRLGSP